MELQQVVTVRDTEEIWHQNPTQVCNEIQFIVCGLLLLLHALKNGGRLPYLWLTILLNGLVTELLAVYHPDINNHWHAQHSVMFNKQRLPLATTLMYPILIFTSHMAVARMRLSRWAEPFAAGLATVLLDVPFELVGHKFIWWTWHDTDPNVFDRSYWVPINNYFFMAAMSASTWMVFFATHKIFTRTSSFEKDSFFRELLCVVLTVPLSQVLAVVQFVPLYTLLHDLHQVPSSVCAALYLGTLFLIVWMADRRVRVDDRKASVRVWFSMVTLVVWIHYIQHIVLVIIGKPEDVVSVGIHETIGNCNETVALQGVVAGNVLTRRKFLCVSDFDEGYYDFHCLPGGKAPSAGSSWYKICGTPFPNHVEYMIVVIGSSLLGLFLYNGIMLRYPFPFKPVRDVQKKTQ